MAQKFLPNDRKLLDYEGKWIQFGKKGYESSFSTGHITFSR